MSDRERAELISRLKVDAEAHEEVAAALRVAITRLASGDDHTSDAILRAKQRFQEAVRKANQR